MPSRPPWYIRGERFSFLISWPLRTPLIRRAFYHNGFDGQLDGSHNGKRGLLLQLTTHDEARLVIFSRSVVDLIYRHRTPNAAAISAIKACHQNNRGRAAFIERRERIAPTSTPEFFLKSPWRLAIS